MSKEKVVDIVEQLAAPIVQQEGLELVDVEYAKEGANWFLRVFIDKPGGVDIEDCGRVSEVLSAKLDEVDPIPTSYFLEVSSPGAERPLKKPADYEKAIGKKVHITTYEPFEGKKEFVGELVHYDGELLIVNELHKTVRKKYEIPFNKIAQARLSVF
ncbi:ribosome maturation factor RimP [Effusibacillus lacus]|uniref:Ribosome maturation factor RimP n=1 Tax=Effusibacillus lacus TaxID=1348429 RepID=A0A292YP70_9BACL|nr:ribosome maturation factor RimP [Effusibacillus lacus]TCS73160.1 ribosome maturation factor RimP [Effusibacillus lacus]GAX90563.1 ribosome maturation factor RimP [Effusibacillus lacus]